MATFSPCPVLEASIESKVEISKLSNKMFKISIKTICNVLLPLLLGALIYVSFRSKSLTMFNWFDIIGISNWVISIRNIFHPLKHSLPAWVYYSLPDALWVYSFSASYLLLWKNNFNIGRYWLLIPLSTGCFVELAQGLKLMKGTFDPIDLLLDTSAFILSVIIIRPKTIKHENQFS